MKKLLLFYVFIAFFMFCSYCCFAIPANPMARTIKQSNGKQLTFILQGDEKVHWAKTLDGYTLLKNSDGDFVYAHRDERGSLIPSQILACNPNERNQEEQNFVATLTKDLRYSSLQVHNKLQQWNAPQNSPLRTGSFPTIGRDSLLVILVDFADLPFTYTNQDFVNLTSQSNFNGYGSVKDYYLDNSNNRFEMAIRVVGPYTLPQNMAYYGNYNGQNEDYGYQVFVHDVLELVDPYVDFSHFDNDNDGEVDGFHIIFAGTPESTTGNENEIWPHRWVLWAYDEVRDGKNIWTYACSAEKRSATQMDGIGTMCHEFGHVLGLPDNYDADYSESGGNSVTTGAYDLMASGSYNNGGDTPPYLSIGEKIITNWVGYVDTLSSPRDSVPLRPIDGTMDTGYYVGVPNSSEFFIFEMRKKRGWDAFLPGEGMLIYHGDSVKINAWLNTGDNTINVTPSQRGWFIEPSTGVIADGVTANAPFGSVSGVTSFSSNSPNSPHLNNGTAVDLRITNIHYTSDSTMSFNFNSSILSIEVNDVDNNDTYADGFPVSGYIEGVTTQTITQKGVVYNTLSSCPFVVANAIYDTTNGTNINVNITGLTEGKYYYRAFAYVNGNLMLSDVKSATTRAMEISNPYSSSADTYTYFNFTPHTHATKFTSHLEANGWIVIQLL